MKIFSSKKRVAAIGVVTAATLVGGGMAYAYWTSTGTGTGTATAGAADEGIEVAATVTGLLTPGGAPGVVNFTADNPEAFNQKLTTIHLDSISTTAAGCSTSLTGLTPDFSMADVTVGAEGNLDSLETGKSLGASGLLYMLDTDQNQNACQNAPLTLTFTTS